MKSIHVDELYRKLNVPTTTWIVDVITSHKIPFFVVELKQLKDAGLICGRTIRKIGWELDKTTAIYSEKRDFVSGFY
jgi:hypothetical protein